MRPCKENTAPQSLCHNLIKMLIRPEEIPLVTSISLQPPDDKHKIEVSNIIIYRKCKD